MSRYTSDFPFWSYFGRGKNEVLNTKRPTGSNTLSSNNIMIFFKKAQTIKPTEPPVRSHDITADLNSNRTSTSVTINNLDNVDQAEFVRLLPGDKMPNQGKMMFKSFISLYLMLLIEVGIPLALYYGLRNKIGVIYALVISARLTCLWVSTN